MRVRWLEYVSAGIVAGAVLVCVPEMLDHPPKKRPHVHARSEDSAAALGAREANDVSGSEIVGPDEAAEKDSDR
jgi:hypothetical protein